VRDLRPGQIQPAAPQLCFPPTRVWPTTAHTKACPLSARATPNAWPSPGTSHRRDHHPTPIGVLRSIPSHTISLDRPRVSYRAVKGPSR